MKKRILAMALAGAMSVGMLAGCGSSSSGSSSSGSGTASSGDGEYTISVIMKTASSEYWQYIQAGAKAYGDEHDNVTVEIKGPTSETAYDEQQNMIETDLNSGAYDALVIAPLQSDLVTTLISGTDMPIVALDTNVEADEVVTFVGTGNEAAAAMGGEAAVEAAKAAGWEEVTAIEICGVQGDATNEARYNGFMSGIEEAGGEFLEDETQYADAVADKAVTCMEAIMQNHPEGVAIICANNDDMAIAAARAAEGNEAYANTIFLGFDGDAAACESIIDGELDMTVAQDGYNMAYMAVEAAVAALEGEELDEFIDSGTDIIDSTNAQERLDTLEGYLS